MWNLTRRSSSKPPQLCRLDRKVRCLGEASAESELVPVLDVGMLLPAT